MLNKQTVFELLPNEKEIKNYVNNVIIFNYD